MTKSVCMLNSGSETLDEIIEVIKTSGDIKGIVFNYSSLNTKSKFVHHVKRLISLCQVIYLNILLDLVSSTLLLITKALMSVTTVAKRVIYDLFATNYMVDLTTNTIIVPLGTLKRFDPNKCGNSKKQLQVILATSH